MRFELRPGRNVELIDGHYIATSAEPWLTLDAASVPALAGRLIELTYRASLWDEPVRPVLRFWSRDGSFVDRIANGPVAGAGIWTGRLPRGTLRIGISPTNRCGRFDFRIERLRPRTWLAVLLRGARQNPKSARSALLTKLIGWGPESDVNLAWATTGMPLSDFAAWHKARTRPVDLEDIDRPRFDWASAAPMQIAIIEGDRTALAITIASLEAQVFPYWTATIFSDGAANVSNDKRVSVRPARCQQTGLAFSPGTITTVLKAGDGLAPESLAHVAEQAHRYPACRLFYGDALHRGSGTLGPTLRPGWSPRLFAAQLFLEAPVFVRDLPSFPDDVRQSFVAEGRLETRFLAGLGALDARPLRRFLLDTREVRPCRFAARVPKAVSIHEAVPRSRRLPETRSVQASPWSTSSVAIIILTRDHPALLRRAVASIRARTGPRPVQIVIVDHGSTTDDAKAQLAEYAGAPDILLLRHDGIFNFSLMCNEAVAAASGDVLVFLNDDTEVLSPDWLDRLVTHAQDPDIGAVGAKLTYPDGRLQHIGVLAGMGGSAGHFGALDGPDAPGWAGRNTVPHEVSAVTGACLAVSRRKFDAVNGFDAVHLPVELGDVDLCLRLNARGWQTIVDPGVRIMHEESASRGGATFRRLGVYESQRAVFTERWRHVLRDDPVFHPGLSLYSWRAALG